MVRTDDRVSVVLVDDSVDVRTLVRCGSRPRGCSTSSGRLPTARRPSSSSSVMSRALVLLDISMPTSTVSRRCPRSWRCPDTPVVMFTGFDGRISRTGFASWARPTWSRSPSGWTCCRSACSRSFAGVVAGACYATARARRPRREGQIDADAHWSSRSSTSTSSGSARLRGRRDRHGHHDAARHHRAGERRAVPDPGVCPRPSSSARRLRRVRQATPGALTEATQRSSTRAPTLVTLQHPQRTTPTCAPPCPSVRDQAASRCICSPSART